jgi:hypothetical protein
MNCWGVAIPREVVCILPWKCGSALAACIERQFLHCIDSQSTDKQIGGFQMTAIHKFKAGQAVTVAPRRYDPRFGGSFRIVRVLPDERGNNQYRIRSVVDGHERVVMEGEIGSG